jgi:hypothetical protein
MDCQLKTVLHCNPLQNFHRTEISGPSSPGLRQAQFLGGALNASIIDRRRHGPRARANKNPAHAEISRVFHQHLVARIEQRLGRNLQRDLSAGHDMDKVELSHTRIH